MSLIVGGEFLLGEKEREFFVRWMWRLSAFLQIEVLDYVVMSNHYQQLVRVPGVIELSDSELLERLKGYYGEESLKAMIFEDALLQGEEAVVPLRTHYLKRMGYISEFEKVLKQGFSSWYNRPHSRRGTLWMERFKSVLVEDSREVRGIMATYIDLNPVRAEMVEDPRNYRHCGYGAAMGGYLSLIVFSFSHTAKNRDFLVVQVDGQLGGGGNILSIFCVHFPQRAIVARRPRRVRSFSRSRDPVLPMGQQGHGSK